MKETLPNGGGLFRVLFYWRDMMKAWVQPLHAVFDMVSGEHAASLAPLLTANGHLACIQDRQEKTPLPPFTTMISLPEVGLNAMHAHADDMQWGSLVAGGAAMARDIVSGRFDPQIIDLESFDRLPAARQARGGSQPGIRVVVL